jgi:CubicO group peptidase (beta-lactamase class C family)
VVADFHRTYVIDGGSSLPPGPTSATWLFEPLGMKDTGFHVPTGKPDRMPVVHATDPDTGALVRGADPRDGAWDRPPAFPSGGGCLVSTADDCLAFCRMMLHKGRYDGGLGTSAYTDPASSAERGLPSTVRCTCSG